MITSQDDNTAITARIVQKGKVVPLGSATTKEFLIELDNGTTLTRAATLVTDGNDGKMEYKIVKGEFGTSGLLKVQTHIITANGEWYSNNIIKIQIKKVLGL